MLHIVGKVEEVNLVEVNLERVTVLSEHLVNLDTEIARAKLKTQKVGLACTENINQER